MNYRQTAKMVGEDPNELELALETLPEAKRRTIERTLVKAGVLATTDDLTRIPNKRGYNFEIDNAVKQADDKGYAVSLLMIDADHFKQLNDTYGHTMGDYALRAIAQVLTDHVRHEDLGIEARLDGGYDQRRTTDDFEYDVPADRCVARVGGEEYAVLLHNTTTQEAEQIGERLRDAVEKYAAWYANALYHDACDAEGTTPDIHKEIDSITISVGVANHNSADVPFTDQAADVLYRQADEALYEAKEKGRNQVAVYRE